MDDLRWMAEALVEARRAAELGEVPVGAVVVDGTGEIVSRAHNTKETNGDPLGHAEILALRQASADGGLGSSEAAADALVDAFRAALSAVVAETEARGADARDLSTTLVAAVCAPGWLAAAQVGDGYVVAQDASGSVRTVSGADGGEYLNETTFLTTAGALDGLRAECVEIAPVHLALLTDGLQMLAMRIPGREPHRPFFDPLFRLSAGDDGSGAADQALASFLAGPRVSARTDDDLTIVLASFTSGGSEQP